MQKIDYYIIPGENSSKQSSPIYNSIYNCWKDVWQGTYNELGIQQSVRSDSFTRQSYIGALFIDNECAAMCFFREIEDSYLTLKDDSYFSCWSEKHLNQLMLHGKNILVSSYFTIHPNFRKGKTQVSMKDLLTGISVLTYLGSDMDTMAANLRIDRTVNKACEKWGGSLIEAGVIASNGQPGDLMLFHKNISDLIRQNENYNFIKSIWDSRIDLRQNRKYQKNENNVVMLHSDKKAA